MSPYDVAFRRTVVARARELRSARRAAREFKLDRQTIHRWVRDAVDDPKWRCVCSPTQTRRGAQCPACGAAEPPR